MLAAAVSFTCASYAAVRFFLREPPLRPLEQIGFFYPNASSAETTTFVDRKNTTTETKKQKNRPSSYAAISSTTTATPGKDDDDDHIGDTTTSGRGGVDGPLNVLLRSCPRIPADGRHVQILSSPSQFFEQLTSRIRRAKRRIVISALYVGDGTLSKQFVESLEASIVHHGEALRRVQFGSAVSLSESGVDGGSAEELLGDNNLATTGGGEVTSRFRLTVLFDYNRMHDRKNLVTIRRLAQLAWQWRRFVDVDLSLFQSPVWLNAYLPGRSKELLGVQHTKIFVFDGEDVVVTGANLSDDYFTTRMDRYMIVEHNAALGAWLTALVESLSRLSHPVVVAPEDAPPPPAPEWEGAEVMLQGMTPLATPVKKRSAVNLSLPTSAAMEMGVVGGSPTSKGGVAPRRHRKSNLLILPNQCGADPARQTAQFCLLARKEFDSFRDLAVTICETATAQHPHADTWLFPTVQFGRIGVHHDASVVSQFLEACSHPSIEVTLTSPYLNMYGEFVSKIMASRSRFTFITASIHTNGWKGQRGFAGTIPFFYLQVERAFYFLMKAYGCTPRVQIREFSEPGMTFHAKGLWLLERPVDPDNRMTTTKTAHKNDGDDDDDVGAILPSIAAYGSTNYGNRSVHKDVEAEVFLHTTHRPLQRAMHSELQRLVQQSTLVTDAAFVENLEGRFQPVISLVAQVGLDYM